MLRWVLALTVVLLTGPAFDGKSLEGWDGLKGHWKAADGQIVGTADASLKFNTFLCTQQKFKDFELSFRVRLKDGKGNSGVQIRSEVMDREKWTVKGPQCDIGAGYWGGLYGENFGGMMQAADQSKLTVKPADFNDYFIRAVGKKVTIKVNGVTTVDAEFEKLPAEGIIALQLHTGAGMEVAFKEIKFKELK
jgi:hypothetical protein